MIALFVVGVGDGEAREQVRTRGPWKVEIWLPFSGDRAFPQLAPFISLSISTLLVIHFALEDCSSVRTVHILSHV